MRKLSPLQAGGLGELLALAKITSIDLRAYLSPQGAPHHDLIVMVGRVAKSKRGSFWRNRLKSRAGQWILRPRAMRISLCLWS